MGRLYLSIDSADACLDILHAELAPAYRPLAEDSLPGTLPELAALTPPGVDSLLFWDVAAATWAFASIGTGLDLSSGVLSSTVTPSSPGGSSGDVQFNNGSGGFAGDGGLNWNNSTKRLTVTDGTRTANLGDGTYAGTFSSSPTAANLARSTQAGRFRYVGGPIVSVCTSTIALSCNDNVAGQCDICDGTYAVNAVGGSINVKGITTETYRWNAGATAPTPQAVAAPGSAFGAGTITDYLGTPDAWVLIRIGGTDYKVPAYL